MRSVKRKELKRKRRTLGESLLDLSDLGGVENDGVEVLRSAEFHLGLLNHQFSSGALLEVLVLGDGQVSSEACLVAGAQAHLLDGQLCNGKR